MRPTQLLCGRGQAAAVLLAAAALLTSASGATAQNAVALPPFTACAQTTAPTLPQRWRAVGLMFPFLRQQLEVGEFVYDGALPALRATLYGLEAGAVDLLITENETYQLSGPPENPDSCTALGRKYAPPARQWLKSGAACDGEAAIASKKVEWWKSAAAEGRTDWQWYASDTRLPWRVMMATRSADPAVIGDYGMTYFPAFTPVAETKLAQLRDFCAAKAQKATGAALTAATARDLMTLAKDVSAAERAKKIQSLIPGLSHKACAGASPPSWPQRFAMTGILSPVQFKWTPLPSLLFYDWPDAATLTAYMYDARSAKPTLEIISMLKQGIGYSVERVPNGRLVCAAKAPGALRPDWMATAGCECKAAIEGNPDLSPGETSYIRACPIKTEGLRTIWSWYTDTGRPILFAEPGAIGSGLNIADYQQWSPGVKMPPDTFDVPELCTRAAELGLPPVGHGLTGAAAFPCSDCHVTQK